jgi:hypothetical protein
MNRIFVIALVAIFAAMTDSSRGASGTFSGRIWNDIDRDGIQDVDEPPMSNFPIYVYDENVPWWCGGGGCEILKTYFTDASGNYEFSHAKTNDNICNYFPPCIEYDGFYINFTLGALGVKTSSVINIEGATLWWEGSIIVSNNNVVVTDHDVGLFYWNVGVTLEITVGNTPSGTPLYVTNGTMVSYTYSVVNTGETYLSQLQVTDDTFLDFLGEIYCPNFLLPSLPPRFPYTFVNHQIIHESVTNLGTVVAIPVDPSICNSLPTYGPVDAYSHAIVIVVTNPLDHADGDVFPNWWEMQYGFDPLNSNAPNVNSDSDWMSNYEEFLAGTNPTNGTSYFSNAGLSDDYALTVNPSVTNRVYNIWRSTNLLGEPQEWSLHPPEQTGTGAAVFFTIPTDDPSAHYRTGVRLP